MSNLTSSYDDLENSVTHARKDSGVGLPPPSPEPSPPKCPPSAFDTACDEMDKQVAQSLAALKALGEGYTPRDEAYLEALAQDHKIPTLQEEAFATAQEREREREQRFSLSNLCSVRQSLQLGKEEYEYSESEYSDDEDDEEDYSCKNDREFWRRIYAPKPRKQTPVFHPNTYILAHVDLSNHKYRPSYAACNPKTEPSLTEVDKALLEVMEHKPDERLMKLEAGLFEVDGQVALARREAYWQIRRAQAEREEKCGSFAAVASSSSSLTVSSTASRADSDSIVETNLAIAVEKLRLSGEVGSLRRQGSDSCVGKWKGWFAAKMGTM